MRMIAPVVRVAARDSKEEVEIIQSGSAGSTRWRMTGTLELDKNEGKGLKTCNVWVQ